VDGNFDPNVVRIAAQPMWYSQTRWLMITGGNRNPSYNEPAAVTIVDPAPPHLPGSPTRQCPVIGCQDLRA